MANLNRGEYELKVNDASYTLALSLNDLETLENSLSVGCAELLDQLRLGNPRMKDVNEVLRSSLRKVKPRLNKQEVETVLSDIPFQSRYTAVLRLIAGSMNLLEEQADVKAEDEDEETAPTEGAREKKEGEPAARPLSSVPANSTGDS